MYCAFAAVVASVVSCRAAPPGAVASVTKFTLPPGRVSAVDQPCVWAGVTTTVVDDRMQTSAPDIYAVGECAQHRGQVYGLVAPGFEQAAVAIFIAMVLDGLDGRVARLTHTQSEFGAEYDSLSDMVSFGVAPSILMYE